MNSPNPDRIEYPTVAQHAANTLAEIAAMELVSDVPEPGNRGTRYKDPASQVNRPASRGDGRCSWLGTFVANGWSISIVPRLTREEWNLYAARADDTFREAGEGGYYAQDLAFLLLESLFPEHKFIPYCAPPAPKEKKNG